MLASSFFSSGIYPWSMMTTDDKWINITRLRNKILSAVGFVYYSDTLTNAEREAGLVYIQSLKDIPQDFINPDDVVFPTPPAYLEDWVQL